MTLIPLSRLVTEVRSIAAEYPNTVAGNRYEDALGYPHCLIGHALHNLGLRVPGRFQSRGFYALPLNDIGLGHAFGPAMKWLGVVQAYCDDRRTWGAAVDGVDRYFPFGKAS